MELERGVGTVYYGNYTDYEEEKDRRLEALRTAHALQQKVIKEKTRIIEKFKAGTRSTVAKSMEKALDKIERIELPPDPRKVRFSFKSVERSGRIVLDVVDVAYSYGDKKIFKNVTFQIERGEKVALVAPNGVGKTTLFNVLCDKFKPQQGSVTIGHNVKQTIFEQEQSRVLDPRKTVIEEVLDSTMTKSESEIRSFLGAFLFGKEEIQKKTKVLSGGEKNRVSMVKVLLQDANLLLLDEPTNHLDISSKEILLRALQQYDGTMLFVSHDHDFVDKLATRVIELTPDGIHSYKGNYESYLHQKEMAERLRDMPEGAEENGTAGDVGKSAGKQSFEAKKETQTLERKIQKLEAEVEKIQCSFADLEYGTSEFSQAQTSLNANEKELKELYKRLAELEEIK